MTGQALRSLGVAIVVGALWLSALALPASAANPVRWVDDDAGAGGGPSQCATAPFTSIQAAIDASESWDRVFVCPGTYTEQIDANVKGVLVKAQPLGQAHIVAPAVMTAGSGGVVALVRLSAWGTRLVGFDLDIEAGDSAVQTFAPTVCTHVDVAVLATGLHTRVRNNAIDSIGTYTYSGTCGYDYGIVFGQHNITPTLTTPALSGLKVSRARGNTVRDFKVGGVLVEGSEYHVNVVDNTIQFFHADDPGCVILSRQTITGCLSKPSPAVPVNSSFPLSFGVGVESAAVADIEGNSITGYSGLVAPQGTHPPFGWGVSLSGADGSTSVVSNAIDGAGDAGITSAGSAGALIQGNTVTNSNAGISISDSNHEVTGNNVPGPAGAINNQGIQVAGSANNIHDNDFAGNAGTDCTDSTSGGGTANTANTWLGDIGNTDSPDGICSPAP